MEYLLLFLLIYPYLLNFTPLNMERNLGKEIMEFGKKKKNP